MYKKENTEARKVCDNGVRFVGQNPLSKLFFHTFRELILLPSSGEGLSLERQFLFTFYYFSSFAVTGIRTQADHNKWGNRKILNIGTLMGTETQIQVGQSKHNK